MRLPHPIRAYKKKHQKDGARWRFVFHREQELHPWIREDLREEIKQPFGGGDRPRDDEDLADEGHREVRRRPLADRNPDPSRNEPTGPGRFHL